MAPEKIESRTRNILRLGAYQKMCIRDRLRSVLDEYSVKADEARILTECAIFADRVAIDEEIVRMRTHLKALYGYMKDVYKRQMCGFRRRRISA